MSAFEISIVYLLVWRIAVLVTGIILIIVGYKLFTAGISNNDGSLHASSGNSSLKMVNIAPGTFFALFGTFIIITIIWKSPAEIVIPKEALENSTAIDMSAGGITVRGD